MKELITLEDINAPVLFGSDDEVTKVIESLQLSARSIVPSIETAKGRKETASIAAKVAKSKTYLDGLGKDLVADIKLQAKEIDGRRKTIRDTLDELKEEVRKPLTEYENREKERIRAHEVSIGWLESALNQIPTQQHIPDIDELLNKANALCECDFEEYKDGASRLLDKISTAYQTRKSELVLAAEQAAEIARLQKEAEERAQKERDDRIAREAADKAKREAEAKADRDRQEADANRRKAEADALTAKQAVFDAERREIEAMKQAELDRQAAILREFEAEKQRIAQQEADEKRHKEQLEHAAKAERDRLAEIKRQEEEQAQARAKDKAHRAKINNEAMESMVSAGASRSSAKAVVIGLAKGIIKHSSIQY